MNLEDSDLIGRGALVKHTPTNREGDVVSRGRKFCIVEFDGKEERCSTDDLTLIKSAYNRLCDAIMRKKDKHEG